jgi:hypothetical protein
MEYVSQVELDEIGAAVIEEQVGEMTTWMYITCRLLAARGLLEFKGMSTANGRPDYFVYSDPRTADLYAVQRPFIGHEAERLLLDRMVSLTHGLPN